MRTKAFSHTDFLLPSPTDASDRPHSLGRGPGLLQMHLRVHNLNQQLFKCEQDILKACDVLLEMYKEVNALLKAYSRQALLVYRGMLEALVDSRKQVIQDGLYDINCVTSDNATNFTLPASNSDAKGSLEILSNDMTSFTPSASVTSFTLTASATSFTVPAAATSFTVSSFTLQAAAMPSTVLAAATSFTMQVAAAATTTSTAPAAATPFTLSVSDPYNEGHLEVKNKCSVAKIGGIKLETKQLKRRWGQIASYKGDRGHNALQPRSPMLFRHKRIKRRDKT